MHMTLYQLEATLLGPVFILYTLREHDLIYVMTRLRDIGPKKYVPVNINEHRGHLHGSLGDLESSWEPTYT